MRICIPTETDDGNDAHVHAHFGSALVYTIYDTHSNLLEYVKNTDHHNIHGMCQPLAVLEGRCVDAVICTGMGARAVQRLNDGRVKTYRVRGKTVKKFSSGIKRKPWRKSPCAMSVWSTIVTKHRFV